MNSNATPPQSTWNLTKIGLMGSAILLVAAIASAFLKEKNSAANVAPINGGNPAGVRPALPANPANPVMMPDNLSEASIALVEGGAKKLSDYRGKVLVVDLWATWCGPCRQEIPHLIQFANDYRDKGVEILGLTNEDPQAAAPLVKEFTKQFKINYPVGWADQNLSVGLMNLSGRNGIPQTLIIGRDGKIRHHFVGFSPAISVPQMKAALEEALAAG